MVRSEKEWLAALGPDRFRTMRQKGIDRAYVGEYAYPRLNVGTYHCARLVSCPFFEALINMTQEAVSLVLRRFVPPTMSYTTKRTLAFPSRDMKILAVNAIPTWVTYFMMGHLLKFSLLHQFL